jgi:hypothetical protein
MEQPVKDLLKIERERLDTGIIDLSAKTRKSGIDFIGTPNGP